MHTIICLQITLYIYIYIYIARLIVYLFDDARDICVSLYVYVIVILFSRSCMLPLYSCCITFVTRVQHTTLINARAEICTAVCSPTVGLWYPIHIFIRALLTCCIACALIIELNGTLIYISCHLCSASHVALNFMCKYPVYVH